MEITIDFTRKGSAYFLRHNAKIWNQIPKGNTKGVMSEDMFLRMVDAYRYVHGYSCDGIYEDCRDG